MKSPDSVAQKYTLSIQKYDLGHGNVKMFVFSGRGTFVQERVPFLNHVRQLICQGLYFVKSEDMGSELTYKQNTIMCNRAYSIYRDARTKIQQGAYTIKQLRMRINYICYSGPALK